MAPVGTHLAYVVFMHHFSQKMGKNSDNDIKCVICSFLVNSLLICVVWLELGVRTSWKGHRSWSQEDLGFNMISLTSE